MRWAEGFIAVDWGTTNRRAYLIGGDGRCAGEMEDDRGVLSIPAGEFPASVEQIRQRLGDRPLLLAGMAGSTRGWVGAPYIPCPAGFAELVAGLVWAEPGKAAIIPGLCVSSGGDADIMRGEEVQILGALAAGTIPPDCTVCHPGTHNKWVTVAGGRIERFRTMMTGEMFNLLKQWSILSEHLKQPVEPGSAFEAGVRRGLACDILTHEIFAVRARVLLGKIAPEDAAPFASGVLIGADVAAGLARSAGGNLFVMGSPTLTALYAQAIRIAGGSPREVDGEGAFIAGAVKIAESLQ